MKLAKAVWFVALLLIPGQAVGQTFDTTVSPNFTIPNALNLVAANSTMQTSWFTGQNGGRTVYSTDVVIGAMVHAPGSIEGHATWVIDYNSGTNTVNLDAGRTHITNWWGDQRCQVYEDGSCNCHQNPNWNICGIPLLVATLGAYAIAARINAKLALEQAGYTVTNN
ncbi:MAG: hypothetical protein E6G97_06795 [Alphaproteobacteria bacterium]|nr:MAG: hypothetical protein E6G97_06795 [Alphaproteobacteria bacterium]